MTDEELELKQTISEEGQERRRGATDLANKMKLNGPRNANLTSKGQAQGQDQGHDLPSPSKEVLIADNSSRR